VEKKQQLNMKNSKRRRSYKSFDVRLEVGRTKACPSRKSM
jgi:hypothetical protein